MFLEYFPFIVSWVQLQYSSNINAISRFDRTSTDNSPEFLNRGNFLVIPLNTKIKTQTYQYRLLRIPRKPRSRQRRWFKDIYGVQRVAMKRRKERRTHRVRSSRITRCRRWYNACISRECISFRLAKSLIGIERTEGSRIAKIRYDFASRLKRRHASGNRKNSRRASRSFLFGACLSARSNKSLRVTVQRPQVSANTKPPSWNASRTLERLRSTEKLQ